MELLFESVNHDSFQYSRIPVETIVFGKCAIFGSLRFLIICPWSRRDAPSKLVQLWYTSFPT